MNLRKKILLMILFSLFYPNWVTVTEANSISYQDPFEYTENTENRSEFLKNGTFKYSDKNDNKNIQNFDFTGSYDSSIDVVTGATRPQTSHVLGRNSFDSGYHEYRDEDKQASVYTKKIVKPTNNPNKFDIQLDVISGKKETKEKIDIAFVFDKSTSMINKNNYETQERWSSLQKSFSFFRDSFFDNPNYDVQIGLSSFGSEGTTKPFFEIAQYPDGSYFVNNQVDRYGNDKRNYLTDSPVYKSRPSNSSGTPTFLGVDAGMALLTDPSFGSRSDAKKFLVFITDGDPTFDASDKYTGIYDNGISQTSKTGDNYSGYAIRYGLDHEYKWNNRWGRYEIENRKYEGNGTSLTINNLQKYVYNLYNKNKANKDVKKYAIGIGNNSISNDSKKILNLIGKDGKNGESYKVQKNIESELKTALDDIESQIISSVSSISNGVLVDEMSDFVTLDKNSLKKYQLKLSNGDLKSTEVSSNNVDQYAKNVIVTPTDNKIEATNITLSGDQNVSNGYRITYQVELKQKFRNGNFYPANKPTFLYDANNTNGIGFAVPSVKNNYRDIPVEKKWIGNQSVKPSITLSLYANGSISDKVTLKNGETQAMFLNKPVLDIEGKTINYEVKETINYEMVNKVKYTSDVSGSVMDGFIVTNTPIADFETKKMASKTNLKPEESFTYNIEVWNTINGSELNNLQVTDTMPEGIEIIGNLKLNNQLVGTYTKDSLDILIPKLIGDEKALITVDVKVKKDAAEGIKKNTATVKPEKPHDPKYPTTDVTVNRESNIILKKTDLDGKRIDSAATFELSRVENGREKIINTLKTNQDGIISFNGLKTGVYRITEIEAPENYDRLEKPIEVVLSNKGELTVKESLSGLVEFKQVDGISQFELLVKNKETPPKPGILPETGGYGYGKYMFFGSVFLGISTLLALYFVFQHRKGWR